MNFVVRWTCLCALLCLSTLSTIAAPPILKSIDDQPIEWQTGSKLRVYAFLGCDCPVAKLYARRIEELQSRFATQGVQWVGVMSSPQDSVE
ncbi:MAG: hypothetical protein ACKO8U_07750, partial [Pirellula sp.]